MPLQPLMTQIVGSYTKPHWLTRHQRMRAMDDSWWRPEAEVLQEAKEDAARLAIYEQERAGLDLLTDGEAQRPSYDRFFLSGLKGIDTARLETIDQMRSIEGARRSETGNEEFFALSRLKPVVAGEIGWSHPVSVGALRFLRATTTKPVKATVIGPLTLATQVADRFYGDAEALALALARALNGEVRALEEAGADVIQIDEPSFHFDVSAARTYGVAALAQVVEGVTVPVIVHVCYGYALVVREKSASPTYPALLEVLSDAPISGMSIEYEQPGHGPDLLRHCGDKHVVLGLLNLGTEEAETADHVARRLDAAMRFVPAERLHPASDCGMWYLPRSVAYAKILALSAGARLVCADG